MYYLRQFWDLLRLPFQALLNPAKFLETCRRITRLSIPAAAAVIMAVFVIACVVTFFVIPLVWLPPEGRTQGFREYLAVGCLGVLIPFLTYFAFRLWMEANVSEFGDIDRAWALCLRELERQGIDLRYTPLFLVFGAEDNKCEEAIFRASRFRFTVQNFPPGPAALHIWAVRDPDIPGGALFVSCTEASGLSHLAQRARDLMFNQSLSKRVAGVVEKAQQLTGETVWPTDLAELTRSRVIPRAPTAAGVMEQVQHAAPGHQGVTDRTMMFDLDQLKTGGAAAVENRPAQKLSADRELLERERRRLRHLANLIERSRRPICPINGALMLVPLSLILVEDPDGLAPQVVAGDLDELRAAFPLRFPVTVLVPGWEAEKGFMNLIGRLGPERTKKERIGKRHDLWSELSAERVQANCTEACAALDEAVYVMFRDPRALERPAGNRHLFTLVCRARRYLKPRLARIAAAAFTPRDRRPTSEELLFGGCYFAATGSDDPQQHFVASLITKKLPDQQEDVAWTSTARATDRRYRRLTYFLFGCAAVLLVVELGVIAVWF